MRWCLLGDWIVVCYKSFGFCLLSSVLYLAMLTNLSLLSYSYELSSSVVFGKVLEGEDVVKRIEEQGTSGGTPKSTVTITDCGEL